MRKLLIIAVLGMSFCACCKSDSGVYSKSSILNSHAEEMFGYVVCDPVNIMIGLDKSYGDEIFGDTFHDVLYYNNNQGKATVDRYVPIDSCWTVKGTYDKKTTYETRVIMTKRDKMGLCSFTSSGAGDYNEGNGYSAHLYSIGDAVFTWTSTTYDYNTKFVFNLVVESQYFFTTFKDGQKLDEFSKTHTGAVN